LRIFDEWIDAGIGLCRVTAATDAPRGLLIRACGLIHDVLLCLIGTSGITAEFATEPTGSTIVIVVTVSARATVIVIVTITATIATAIIETVVSFATDRTARDVTASVSVSFESSPFACAHG